MNVWRSLIAFAVALVAGVTILVGGVFAASALGRIADHEPTGTCGSGTDDGWNYAAGYTQDVPYFYKFGGGALGSGTFCDDYYRWDSATDSWAFMGNMPTGERYRYRSEATSDFYIGMVSDSLSGCDTLIYNAVTDSFQTAVDPPTGCITPGTGAGVGDDFWLCYPTACDILDMTNPAGGWSSGPDPSSTAIANTAAGCMVYDAVEQILVMFDNTGATALYDFSVGSWQDMNNSLPFTAEISVCFYDNYGGVLTGRMNLPTTNSMQIYRLDYDETDILDSEWVAYETWSSGDFAYDTPSPKAYKGGTLTLTGAGNKTRFVFGSGGTDSASPSVNANRWWAYEGNNPAIVPTSTTGNIDFWIEESIGLLELDDTFGHHAFGLFWILFLGFALIKNGAHPLIMISTVALLTVGFAEVDLIPGWTILVAAIVMMVGVIMKMTGGQSGEGATNG